MQFNQVHRIKVSRLHNTQIKQSNLTTDINGNTISYHFNLLNYTESLDEIINQAIMYSRIFESCFNLDKVEFSNSELFSIDTS